MNVTLIVKLPANRDKLGSFKLVDANGEVLFGPRACLAQSDQAAAVAHFNPTRDPIKPYGVTPLGLYHMQIIPAAIGDPDAYGIARRFLLVPMAGPCVLAESAPNLRAGLLIHGGALNPKYTFWDGLRPTYGCLRLHDSDMLELARQHDIRAADDWRCDVSEATTTRT